MTRDDEMAVFKHPQECPFVDRSFIPMPKDWNIPIEYSTDDGDYIFYDHNDGFGNVTRVQFCKLIGRKRDVFECFNESEWKACSHYRGRQKDDDLTT